ncbi:hypothetical protein ACFLYS_01710 [Chloroflexota bacterium]
MKREQMLTFETVAARKAFIEQKKQTPGFKIIGRANTNDGYTLTYQYEQKAR